jgi:hypothetical protein
MIALSINREVKQWRYQLQCFVPCDVELFPQIFVIGFSYLQDSLSTDEA